MKRPAAARQTCSTHRPRRTLPPKRWQRDWPLIEELRRTRDAPVDTVGCERLADPKASKRDFEWQCLVAAMLSSQTKDQANAEAMLALRSHGNTALKISRTPEATLDRLIRKVGFHRTKAKNIRAAAKSIVLNHGGRVPRTLEGLMALAGVGPKMAHLVMHAAFEDQQGLCIDTHIHRLANALGWIRTTTPERTRLALEAWLPRQHWSDFNVAMVGLGQQQQQEAGKLVARSLTSKAPLESLKLLRRMGLKLQVSRFPQLATVATPALRRLFCGRW